MGGTKSKHRDIRTDSDACPPPKKRGWLSGGSSRGGGGCCCGGDMHEEVVIIEKIQPERYAKDGSGSMPKSMSHTKTVGKKKAGGSSYVVMPLSDFNKMAKGLPEHKSVVLRRFIENDIYNLCLSPQEIEMCLNAFKRNADIVDGDAEAKMAKEVFMSLIGISTGVDADVETDESIMLELLFQQFDQDGDGYLDRTEFLVGFSFWKNELNDIPAHEKAKFWFTLFDKNRDGTLDETEFTQMIEHVLLANEGTEGRTGSETQAPDVSVTMDTETSDMIHEWLEQAFNEADKDGDMMLSIQEFDEWIESHGHDRIQIHDTSYPVDVVQAALRLSFTEEGLSKHEFSSLIQRTLAFDVKPSDKVVDRAKTLALDLFAKVDADGGGTVCFDEYSAWLNANPEYAYNFTCSVGGEGSSTQVEVTKRGGFRSQLSMQKSTRRLEITMRRSLTDKESSMRLQSSGSCHIGSGIFNPLQPQSNRGSKIGNRSSKAGSVVTRVASRSYVGNCRTGDGEPGSPGSPGSPSVSGFASRSSSRATSASSGSGSGVIERGEEAREDRSRSSPLPDGSRSSPPLGELERGSVHTFEEADVDGAAP